MLVLICCEANMSPEWTAAYTKAKAALAKLTLSQKVDLATGVGWMKGNGDCNQFEAEKLIDYYQVLA
jgi:hypothetical protein